MNLIKKLAKTFYPESNETVVSCTLNDALDVYLHRSLMDGLIQEVTSALAEAYIAQHGVEILKCIEEKTIDAKVIQKVVANLRKELKEGYQGRIEKI